MGFLASLAAPVVKWGQGQNAGITATGDPILGSIANHVFGQETIRSNLDPLNYFHTPKGDTPDYSAEAAALGKLPKVQATGPPMPSYTHGTYSPGMYGAAPNTQFPAGWAPPQGTPGAGVGSVPSPHMPSPGAPIATPLAQPGPPGLNIPGNPRARLIAALLQGKPYG